MKKGLLLLLVGIVLIASFPLIAEGQGEMVGSTKPIVMKIGHSFSEDTARHKALKLFKTNVEEKSNGRISVELYPSNTLGTEMEMLESIKMNTLEGLQCGPFDDASPELLVFTLPFLFSDMNQVHKVTRSDYAKEIVKATEANGIKVLAIGDSGEFRQFTNNKHPINEPKDLVGLKIRTPPMDSIIKIVEALGGNPVSIPFAELYMALKTNIADGQENPLTNIEQKKLYEVQKYLSMVNYQYHAEMFYVPLDWFNSLDADLQEIVQSCAQEAMLLNDELLSGDTLASYEILKKEMIVNTLTASEREVFIEACKPVYDYYINNGVVTQERIDKILQIANN